MMERRKFIKSIILAPIALNIMSLKEFNSLSKNFNLTSRFPVIFIGHGNPMNVIMDNSFTRSLSGLGKSFKEKPNAILVVSAHWLTNGTHVMVSAKPKTIHDFGGFPEELYQIQYPAPGYPELAKELKHFVSATQLIDDEQWGLDHGAWTVLKHMFPEATIPVFQLSIDASKSPDFHFKLATELTVIREKGVLIIGSGNIVHNLYKMDFDLEAKPFDWAIDFDEIVKMKLLKREFEDLINYDTLGQAAKLSIPTNDHYLPMLYTLGLSEKKEELKFIFEEIQNASISMRCFQIG